jgi:lipoprotein-releasing system permease protein
LEKRRSWQSFGLATGVGLALTLGLALGVEQLAQWLWPDLDPGRDALAFALVGLEGLAVGAVLGRLVNYYPSLEGLLASAGLAGLSALRAGLGLDPLVEVLLKFEAHFAGLYLGAFILFLVRGGGLFYPRFIGLRYLRFKMITGITVIGVALGVAGLMVVLSVMSGFEMDLKEKIVGTNAHAVVRKKADAFAEYRPVADTLRTVRGVVAATPFIYNEVMASSEFNLSGVFIRGIDPKTVRDVTELEIREGGLELLVEPQRIDDWLDARFRRSVGAPPAAPPEPEPPPAKAEPEAPPVAQPLPAAPADEVPDPMPLSAGRAREPLPGVLIGAELKKILKVRVGDRIHVVSPLSEELGPTGPMPKARTFRVAGVFYTGMYEYDAKSIYVTLPAAQAFFGMDDAVTGIALRFDDIDRAEAICDRIEQRLGGWPYTTRTWYEMNRSLFSALKMEKVAMFLVLVIVILVSAFGIVSTLIMLVWEKVKEIAILKSMGATGDGVMKIFMIEGITIGLVGTLLGMLVGWVACLVLQKTGVELNQDVYYIESLPVNIDPVEFLLIAGIALHISFIATIYPSRRASRLRPVEGLRYD